MAGIGRDYPPITIPSWPKVDPRQGDQAPAPKFNGTNFGDDQRVATRRSAIYLSNLQQYRVQCLGVAVAAAAGGKPEDYPDILHRDIFEPLGLSSTFNLTEETASNVAVSTFGSSETDLALGPYNPAGGQFSSLKDLTKVMQTFLDPSRKESLLSPYTMREWLRPIHGFPDDLTEVGGNLLTSHSIFIFDPTTSFGVIVLMTGLDHNALKIAINAIQIFQRAFDQLLERTTMELYGGHWKSDDGKSEAITYVEKGSLWLSRLFLNGTDIFELLEGPLYPRGRRYGIWTTGRDEEFRVSTGRPELSENVFVGCFAMWATIDPIFAKGAPVDLILFGGGPDERVAKGDNDGSQLHHPTARWRGTPTGDMAQEFAAGDDGLWCLAPRRLAKEKEPGANLSKAVAEH
ncbi:hypothetical protein FS837_006870 [Tulasnella sp. UAMH 9824]|nr:hypothetical protein FS837_006870 [Tulasnella sp. UAMH 9824]